MESRWQRLRNRLLGATARWADGAQPPMGENGSTFDELAKGLAQGMSRREALRLVGTALLGTVLLPLGRGAAWAKGRPACNENALRSCRNLPTLALQEECLESFGCTDGCCSGKVCAPGTEKSACGRIGGVCDDCLGNEVCINRECCIPDETNTACCPAERICLRDNGRGCCPPGQVCIGDQENICCPPQQVCEEGSFCCPPGQFCDPETDFCKFGCGTIFPTGCPEGFTCCCCPDSPYCDCVDPATGITPDGRHTIFCGSCENIYAGAGSCFDGAWRCRDGLVCQNTACGQAPKLCGCNIDGSPCICFHPG